MEKATDWTPESAAAIIDQSLLRPNATEEEMIDFCETAIKYKFCTVTINPSYVATAWEKVKGSSVKVCSVVSFPFGLSMTDAKVAEARGAVRDGAEEVDVVANIGAEKSHRFDFVFQDAKAVVDAVRKMNHEVLVKAIIETCYLTDEEKESASSALVRAGVDFVKTSTGYGSGGATVHDVALIRRVVGPRIGVKASGGIGDVRSFSSMAAAGANRIGTSHGVEIVRELRARTV
jgi:deoxyribose-phosphate aldolase